MQHLEWEHLGQYFNMCSTYFASGGSQKVLSQYLSIAESETITNNYLIAISSSDAVLSSGCISWSVPLTR